MVLSNVLGPRRAWALSVVVGSCCKCRENDGLPTEELIEEDESLVADKIRTSELLNGQDEDRGVCADWTLINGGELSGGRPKKIRSASVQTREKGGNIAGGGRGEIGGPGGGQYRCDERGRREEVAHLEQLRVGINRSRRRGKTMFCRIRTRMRKGETWSGRV